MHRVFINGGDEIVGAESVQTDCSRKIETHHGLGTGFFPVAGDQELRQWTINCQQENADLFPALDQMLKDKKETELVIVSDAETISESAYLESYGKTEESAGAFDITLKFIEHRPAGVKTIDVPYIARPGKIPKPPETVVFKNSSEVAQDAMKRHGGGGGGFGGNLIEDSSKLGDKLINGLNKKASDVMGITYSWKDTDGNIKNSRNPCLIPYGIKVSVITQGNDGYLTEAGMRAKREKETVTKTRLEQHRAYLEFNKKQR